MRTFRNSAELPKPLMVNGKDELVSVTQKFNRMTPKLANSPCMLLLGVLVLNPGNNLYTL